MHSVIVNTRTPKCRRHGLPLQVFTVAVMADTVRVMIKLVKNTSRPFYMLVEYKKTTPAFARVIE